MLKFENDYLSLYKIRLTQQLEEYITGTLENMYEEVKEKLHKEATGVLQTKKKDQTTSDGQMN